MTSAADIASENARQSTGQFGPQVRSAPEVTFHRDISTWGEWNKEEGFFAIDVENVGLRWLPPSEQAAVNKTVWAWLEGDQRLDPPVDVPTTAIVNTMQPILRRDALQWYYNTVREHEDTFDDQVSFYGAEGPLGILHPDGTITLIDGNHRFASEMLRGERTFRLQLLQLL